MTWKYRVIRRSSGIDDPSERYLFSVHEVHTDDEGHPVHWTADPVSVTATNLDELGWVLQTMKQALALPTLEEHADKLEVV